MVKASDSNSESNAYDVTALKWEVLPQVHMLAKKNAGYVDSAENATDTCTETIQRWTSQESCRQSASNVKT